MRKRTLLKQVLLLCALMVGSGSAWAEEETITLTCSNVSSTTSYPTTEKTFTESDVTFGYVNVMINNSNGTPTGWASKQVMQCKANGELYNTDAISGLKNIRVYLVVNTNAFTVFYGNASKPTTDANSVSRPTTPTGTESIDYTTYANKKTGNGTTNASYYDFDLSGKDATYFRIKNGSGANYIYKIVITYDADDAPAASVANPTFTIAGGDYTTTQTVKVDEYDDNLLYFYTTDGTEPDCDENLDGTGTSEEYNDNVGIAISQTTTLKMIAVDEDGNKSSVTTATYTFPYKSIAEFMAANTMAKLDLTGAQVVYIDENKKNIYVRDASGAIDLFNSTGFSTSLTTGDILSGVIEGKYSPYKNLPEIANIVDINALTTTGNETVIAKVIDGTTAAIAANLCDLVKIENTEITTSDSKYYVGDNSDIQLYDNFSVGYTVTTGKAVDVSGIATVYNTTYELFPRYETDIVYLASSEAVEIGANGGMTYCSSHALDFTGVDAIEVYKAKVENKQVILTRIKKVPAEEGVILMSATGSAVDAINVPYLTTAADDVADNALVGVTVKTPVAYNPTTDVYNYIMQKSGSSFVFNYATGANLKANRAYLSTSYDATTSGAPALEVIIGGENGDDNTTAVSEKVTVDSSEASAPVYNLAGQRVSQPTKGLYIVNGKKVIIK